MRKLRVSLWAMEKELKDLESGICKKEKVIMSRDAIFDELSMFHSKFVEILYFGELEKLAREERDMSNITVM